MVVSFHRMGFKVVIPDDGSGQMFLVPPGADPNNIPTVSDGDEILYRGMLDERPQGEPPRGVRLLVLWCVLY